MTNGTSRCAGVTVLKIRTRRPQQFANRQDTTDNTDKDDGITESTDVATEARSRSIFVLLAKAPVVVRVSHNLTVLICDLLVFWSTGLHGFSLS